MYTIQIDRSGQVQILLSVLEPSRNQNTDNLNQVEDRRESVNTEINFEKNQFQGRHEHEQIFLKQILKPIGHLKRLEWLMVFSFRNVN